MKPTDRGGALALVLAAAGYGLLLFITGNDSVCVFKVYAGLPCPTCGMTRSYLSLLHMDFKQAFYWHPLWWLVILGPGLYAGLKLWPRAAAFWRPRLIWGGLVLFLGVYALRMYLFFPDTPPMDFNERAVPFQFLKAILRF